MRQSRTLFLIPLLLAPLQAQVNNVVSLLSRGGAVAGLCPGVAAELDLNTQKPGAPLTIAIGGKDVPITSRPVCCGFPAGVTDEAFVQLPWDAPVGSTSLTVTQNGAISAPFPVTLTQYCPAIVGQEGENGSPFSFQTTFAGASPFINSHAPAAAGETVFMGAVGLGPTSPLVPPGSGMIANVSTIPTVTVGNQQAPVLAAGLAYESIDVVGLKQTIVKNDFAYPGFYQVVFNVPAGLAAGSYPVVITQGGMSSQPVNLAVGGSDPGGRPSIMAVTNAANFHVYEEYEPTPGDIVSVYASNLPPVTQTSGIFPATSYQGIQVTWGSIPLPIYAIDGPSNQINVELPPQSRGNTLSVTTPAGQAWYNSYILGSLQDDIGVVRLADDASGVFQLNGKAWLAMSASLAAQYSLPACTGLAPTAVCAQAAKANDSVTMYLVGGGLATPGGNPSGQPLALGALAPADGSTLYQLVNLPQITVGGIAVPASSISFAGIAPGTAGEYQVNFTIPAGVPSGDAVPVVVTGQTSTDTVNIAIQ